MADLKEKTLMNEQKQYLRFELSQRIEHLLLIISFSTLAITGLPQKFPLNGLSQVVLFLLGGIEMARIIHRIAVALFLVESIYHFAVMGYKIYVLRLSASMLPEIKDAIDGIQAVMYNLGFRKDHPRMKRYNFAEKLEYWALVWGLVIMGLTGFMLLNPIATANVLPGQVIPASKAAHGMEAILAVLAIIIWHFYFVHLRSWNWAMINGKLTRHQMEDEHPLELEQIEQGPAYQKPEAKVLRQRKMIYLPIATVITVVLLIGTFKFMTFEKTAIATLIHPVSTEQIFVPQTATPAPLPTLTLAASPTSPAAQAETAIPQPAVLTWDGGVNTLFKDRCGACHGVSGGFSVASYADLIKGGKGGTELIPGDALNSALVKMQAAGGHAGQFTTDELDKVKAWIQAGALEK
jgi:cytochrome b subunit of formate dehydrogenase